MDPKITIQASLMKLGMWTGGNMLIMHIIFILLSQEIVVAMATEKVQMLQKHMDP